MTNWEIQEAPRCVVYKDGQPLVDERGKAWLFESRAAAQYAIDNWDQLRMPRHDELQGMSDDELHRRTEPMRRAGAAW